MSFWETDVKGDLAEPLFKTSIRPSFSALQPRIICFKTRKGQGYDKCGDYIISTFTFMDLQCYGKSHQDKSKQVSQQLLFHGLPLEGKHVRLKWACNTTFSFSTQSDPTHPFPQTSLVGPSDSSFHTPSSSMGMQKGTNVRREGAPEMEIAESECSERGNR